MPWRHLQERAARHREARRTRTSKQRLFADAELGPNPDSGPGGLVEFSDILLMLGFTGAVLLLLGLGGLGWRLATVVGPWLSLHRRAVLGVLVGGVVIVLLVLVRRPWLVEAERQGLAGAPRRVWRVVGWRRSGQCVGEVARAIEHGRLDVEPGGAASAQGTGG